MTTTKKKSAKKRRDPLLSAFGRFTGTVEKTTQIRNRRVIELEKEVKHWKAQFDELRSHHNLRCTCGGIW